MPSLAVNPRVLTPLASVTLTATNTGASFQLPVADAYLAILDVGAVTGTTPTLDVAFQHSPDNGTSWYTFAKFAQVTATGQRSLIFTPNVSISQNASEQAVATTGAAVTINTPIVYSAVRVLSTAGGTTPSFGSVKLFIICQPASSAYLS